jgi:hypothetical protein
VVPDQVSLMDRSPVLPVEVRIESLGLRPIDRRRLDVAVDLTPCSRALDVEMVIVGPGDEELCSVLLLDNRLPMVDKVMHLRRDAEPGEYVLHVGVFYERELVTRAARRFAWGAAPPE